MNSHLRVSRYNMNPCVRFFTNLFFHITVDGSFTSICHIESYISIEQLSYALANFCATRTPGLGVSLKFDEVCYSYTVWLLMFHDCLGNHEMTYTSS